MARHVLRRDLKKKKNTDISQTPHQLIRIPSDWDTNIPGGGEAVCSALVSSGNVNPVDLLLWLSAATCKRYFFGNSEDRQRPCS